jgi:hypothetical protein
MTGKRKRRIVTAVGIILAFLLVLQLQPFVVKARGGVDGSFGYHPLSDDCLGWVGPADSISWLPFSDFEFHLGYFNYHYFFIRDNFDENFQMCLGQDIDYGE